MDHISPALFELVPVYEGVNFDVIFLLAKGKEVADCVETHGCGHQLRVLLLA